MIADFLTEGAENARTGKALCSLLNLTHRELTKGIEKERREGAPICATCNSKNPGYYLAATREEMKRYCDRLYKRAGEIFKTRRACLRSMDELPAGDTDE